MTQHEFADVVLDCKILTQDESYTIVKYLNSIRNTPIGFPETKRLGTDLKELFKRCCRFGSVVRTGSGYPYSSDKKDSLSFKVDKDIFLLGVTLCGSRNCDYSAAIKLKRFNGLEYRGFCSKIGTFSSVCIKSDLVSYYSFNVFFDSPVDIKKGRVRHRLEASISGDANSCFGQNGQPVVMCSGVRFEFFNNSESTNGTKVERGQFPGFLFTVK